MGRAQGPSGQGTACRRHRQTDRQKRERVVGCRGAGDGLARWGRSCNASPNDWLAGTRCATRQCVPFVMDLVWVAWGGLGWVDVTKQNRAR